MADEPNAPFVLLPTTKTRILKEVREVPEHHRTYTLITVARCLHESAGKPLLQVEALLAIAAYVPGGTIAAPLPGAVRAAFKEVNEALGYLPLPPTVLGGAPAVTTPTVLVETSSEKEQREKTVVVGGVKFLKNVDRPYTALYPHFWNLGSFNEWKTTFNDFAASRVPDHCKFKQKMLFVLMEQWFAMTKANPWTLETCPPHVVRTFNATMQLLLELYLLSGVTLQSSPTVATATFASLCEERSHSGAVLNYFEDLRKASESKEVAKPKYFR
jgi:hypothetical protein